MVETLLIIALVLPTAMLLFTRLISSNNKNGKLIIGLTKIAPMISVAVSIVAFYLVYKLEVIESSTIGWYDLGLSIRVDTLSLTMYAMVSIIALVVMRFSYNYLDGEKNQVRFIGNLAVTIASVQLLVLSGNIFLLFITWITTSMALHRLLLFYPERKKAVAAAKKKFVVARLGDLSFLGAIILIYSTFGNGNLTYIFQEITQLTSGDVSIKLEITVILLVITASLKSAQIPFHGWLLDVMEAPTPVSALLHAGLLNAGPFLVIRFAYLLDGVTYAPIILFFIGAASAIYGAIVFTAQPNIKTALAYSSIGHMGFSFMVCGLGVYSASLLHLVAHSFYKAHSFLTCGSVVEKVRTKPAETFLRKGNVFKIILGVLTGFALFELVAFLWGLDLNSEFQLLIISSIIFIGIASLLVNAFDSTNNPLTILKLIGGAILVLLAFFALEESTRLLLGNQVPEITEPTIFMKYLSSAMLGLFFITVFTNTLSPLFKKSNFSKKLGVHARNGFYLNTLLDRISNSISHNRNLTK